MLGLDAMPGYMDRRSGDAWLFPHCCGYRDAELVVEKGYKSSFWHAVRRESYFPKKVADA